MISNIILLFLPIVKDSNSSLIRARNEIMTQTCTIEELTQDLSGVIEHFIQVVDETQDLESEE